MDGKKNENNSLYHYTDIWNTFVTYFNIDEKINY